MKVYDIREEFRALQDLINNEEFDEVTGELINNDEAIQQLLKEIECEKSIKADSIAFLVKQANDSEMALKAEVDRLNARKKMFIKQQDSLKQLLDDLLYGQKLKTDRFTFSYRTTKSVNIIDESAIPAEFLNVVETIKPDKKAIKDALADGLVDGCELLVKKSLSFR